MFLSTNMLNEIIMSVFVSSVLTFISFFDRLRVFFASLVARKSKKITKPVTRFKYVVNKNMAERREGLLIKALSQNKITLLTQRDTTNESMIFQVNASKKSCENCVKEHESVSEQDWESIHQVDQIVNFDDFCVSLR